MENPLRTFVAELQDRQVSSYGVKTTKRSEEENDSLLNVLFVLYLSPQQYLLDVIELIESLHWREIVYIQAQYLISYLA